MSTMMKAMRFVGDLDDDFYKDERQRDVWNEASAVGLQSVFWAIFVSSAILLGRRPNRGRGSRSPC